MQPYYRHMLQCFALCLSFLVLADNTQGKTLDLSFSTEDSLAVIDKLELFESLQDKDSLNAFKALQEAKTILSKITNATLEAELLFKKARYFERKYQFDSALTNYTKAQRIFNEENHTEREAESIVNRIMISYDISEYAKCISLGHELLKLQQTRKDSLGVGNALKYIGIAYDYVDEHDVAIKFYQDALEIYSNLDNKERQGAIYHNLAGLYNDEGEKKKSISNYNKALEIAKILGDSAWMASLYINFGLVYDDDDPGTAEKLYVDGLNIALLVNDITAQGFAYQNLASVNIVLKKYTIAEQYATKCLKLGQQLNVNQLIENSHDRLYQIYYATGKYKKAIEHLKLAEQISDSIYTQSNAALLKEMQAKYEFDKKSSENDLLRKETEIQESKLKRKNTTISLLVLLFVVLVIGSAVFYRGNYVRKQLLDKIRKQKEDAEKDREIIEHQSEKLKEHDITKSRFFANVSHDFRTPLTLIMGSLEKIRLDSSTALQAESFKDLERAEKNCHKLLFLANEINELNRLDEGSLKLHLKNLKVGSFVKLITDMFSSAADSQLISLYYESTLEREQVIKADPDHFERIIYNLLTNALKFTPQGGRISVKIGLDVSEGDNLAIIKISDTGKGIAKNSLPYVFNRFYQSIKNDYSEREGFGIGLALVKELVAMHDGKISVSSKESVGTTFTLKFPVVPQAADNETITPQFSYDPEFISVDVQQTADDGGLEEHQPKKVNRSAKSILIVEDHQEIAEYINGIISKNYNTLVAPNGKVALEILGSEDVGLVVTDLMMPWMDGFSLVEAMKSDEALRKIPIMVVSARTSNEDRTRVLQLGVNDFLIKPFKSQELLLRIGNLIQNTEQWHEELGSLFINNEGKLLEFEKDLVKKLEELVVKNVSNSRFSVLQLADEMAASERQIYRMIKKLSGMTPYEYIKEVRWQYIEHLLKNNKVTSVSEAAKQIGMSNVTDFKKQFSKRFNKLPSEYIS